MCACTEHFVSECRRRGSQQVLDESIASNCFLYEVGGNIGKQSTCLTCVILSAVARAFLQFLLYMGWL